MARLQQAQMATCQVASSHTGKFSCVAFINTIFYISAITECRQQHQASQGTVQSCIRAHAEALNVVSKLSWGQEAQSPPVFLTPHTQVPVPLTPLQYRRLSQRVQHWFDVRSITLLVSMQLVFTIVCVSAMPMAKAQELLWGS